MHNEIGGDGCSVRVPGSNFDLDVLRMRMGLKQTRKASSRPRGGQNQVGEDPGRQTGTRVTKPMAPDSLTTVTSAKAVLERSPTQPDPNASK